MASCAACGKPISGGGAGGIRAKERRYHLRCAPDGLIADATDEWGAIFDRGIGYFLGKYSLLGEPKRGSRSVSVGHFADLGRKLLAESKRRNR